MLKEFISLEDALRLGKNLRGKLDIVDRVEELNVLYSTDRFSAEKIVAPKSFPDQNKSAVDGYAVNSKFVLSASDSNLIEMDVLGISTPDEPFTGEVRENSAVKVLTGAKIPDGLDAVVMDEEVIAKDNKIIVRKGLRPFQNISIIGEDIKAGSTILERGEIIDPAKIVAMLETGLRTLKVLEIRVGVLSTGDELIRGKVKNSTQYFLIELLKKMGYTPVNLGIAGDDVNDIYSKINVDNIDSVIITGGTGPGEKDFTGKFVEINGELIFHGVKIRPGRTSGLGIINGIPIFLISGLPVAAMIAIENIFDPLMRYWYNLSSTKEYYVSARLSRSIVNTVGFNSFVRVKFIEENGEYKAEPFKVTGSGIISSIIYADGIIVVPENVEGLPENSIVRVKLLRC